MKIKKIAKEVYYRFFKLGAKNGYKFYSTSDEDRKFEHLVEAVNYIRVTQQNLVIFEFGCHSARTFSMMASAVKFFKMKSDHLYAFDSFEGLPAEDKMGVFRPGTFSTSLEKFRKIVKQQSGVVLSEKQTVKGFYSDTLTHELALIMPVPSLIHIDVDLYGSTKDVLSFLMFFDWKRIVLMFDDWYCFPPDEKNGERLAFEEFLQEHTNIRSETWKNYSTFGKSIFLWKE